MVSCTEKRAWSLRRHPQGGAGQEMERKPIMESLVRYERQGSVARITMDDGKVNVLSVEMLTGLSNAFDRAETDKAVVVLTGRAGAFSAGVDPALLRARGGRAPAPVFAPLSVARPGPLLPAPRASS